MSLYYSVTTSRQDKYVDGIVTVGLLVVTCDKWNSEHLDRFLHLEAQCEA